MLDVLTPLSDCRHETVERIMERRISGGSYMCWMDFHNAILCCGFLCARLISVYFVSILCLFCVSFVSSLSFPATTPRATTPHLYRTGYHVFTTTARLPRLPISWLPRHSSLFHSWVITPELSRSTTHVHRAITPAIVSSLQFPFHRLLRRLFSIYTTTGAPHVPTYSTSVLQR